MKTLPVHRADAPMSHDELSRRVFAGEVICFRNLKAARKLARAARKEARKAFHPAHPPHAHRTFNKEEFFARANEAQKNFNSAKYKTIFADILREISLPAEEMFWDTLGLRVNPPAKTHAGGYRSAVKAHRDTWGTALQAQINWWAPVWQLSARRTMGFYPSYWSRPLANTTAQWSLEDFLAARKQAAPGEAAAYPSAPQPLQQPDEQALPVLIRPGELLAFSSAHLHATIPNTTTASRFSFEIRTLNAQDLKQQRGAPNTDCESSPPLYRLFRGIDDNEPPSAHYFN